MSSEIPSVNTNWVGISNIYIYIKTLTRNGKDDILNSQSKEMKIPLVLIQPPLFEFILKVKIYPSKI